MAIVGIVIGVVAVLVAIGFGYQGVRQHRTTRRPEISFHLYARETTAASVVFRNHGSVAVTNLRSGLDGRKAQVWSAWMSVPPGVAVNRPVLIPAEDRHLFADGNGFTCELIAEFDADRKTWRAYQDTSMVDKPPRLARVPSD